MPRARMHDHPGRFVQHSEVRILIEHLEWKRLGRNFSGDNIGYLHRHEVTFPHGEIGSRACGRAGFSAAVDGDVPIVDQVLHVRTGAVLQDSNEKSIEPLAVEVGRDGELNQMKSKK